MSYSSVLKRYYGFQVTIQILFWVPIFYAYQKLMGLSDAQYFEIQSYYYWIFCLLELPTGWLADRLGYRFTLISSALIMVLTHLSAIFWTTYLGFLTHFALIALARALTSGTANAYLYEYLAENDRELEYKKCEGKARSLALAARVLAWAAAGFLFSQEASLPYWLTTAACLISVLCAFALPSLLSESHENKNSKNLKPVFHEILFNHHLLYAILMGVGIFVLLRLSLVNLYQPLMQSKGFSFSSFGLVISVITVFEAFGAGLSHHFSRWFDDHFAIFLSTVIVSLALMAIPYSGQLGTLFCFSVFSFLAGVSYPLVRYQVNAAIKEARFRATLLSLESMIQRIFMGGAAFFCAGFVRREEIDEFLIVMGILIILLVASSTWRLKVLSKALEK